MPLPLWPAGVFAGKLKIYIIIAAVIAVLGGLGFAGYQAIQYGKLLCERATLEAVENERKRMATEVDRLQAEMAELRSRTASQVRSLRHGVDSTGCADTSIPEWVREALRDPAD